jgi:two-component system, LytTR family, response regulator
MMKIRTLIIDDEALARALVQNFIKADGAFEVIGEAADGFEGLKFIQELKPDLILLDIQMPKITGLEMLQLIEEPPLTIFSTAYDQYALQAFEKNAVDYLLKPYSKERFMKALEKIKEKLAQKVNVKEEVSALSKSMANDPEKRTDRIVVKNGNKIEIIPMEKIVYVESYGDYVWIHTSEAKYIKQQTMKDLEDILAEGFLRIHRSNLVNINYIQKLELYGKQTYQLILKNGPIRPRTSKAPKTIPIMAAVRLPLGNCFTLEIPKTKAAIPAPNISKNKNKEPEKAIATGITRPKTPKITAILALFS